MSFNIEVQGGKSYLLPTGGKYCPQDIEIAAIGGKEGLYSWQKINRETSYPTLTPTGITLTPNGNGFTITSSAADAWATHYIHSPSLNTEGMDINVTHTIAGSAYPYFIGFSSKAETVHTAYDHCVYIVNGGTIQHIASNTVAGNYGNYVVGDTIRINLKNGKFSAYKNEVLLFSVDYAKPSVVMNATFYYGRVNYGTIECKTAHDTALGYVVDEEENAYPNEGFADDGYYYVKVGAAKVTPKYASGSATHSSNTITVSGLGFRPYAVMIYYSTSCLACGICNPDGTVASAYGMKGSSSAAATFAPSSDGFKFTYSNFSSYSVPFTWHAVGY